MFARTLLTAYAKAPAAIKYHWHIAEVFIALVVVLAAHIFSTPDKMSDKVLMTVGMGLLAATMTRLAAYSVQESGKDTLLAACFWNTVCMIIALIAQGSGWTWTATAFIAMAAGILLAALMLVVERKEGDLKLVERVTL